MYSFSACKVTLPLYTVGVTGPSSNRQDEAHFTLSVALTGLVTALVLCRRCGIGT